MNDHAEWLRARCDEVTKWFSENPDLNIGGYFDSPLTFDPNTGMLHANIKVWPVKSTTPDACARTRFGTHKVLEILAHGQKTYIRQGPIVETYTRFDNGEGVVFGHARFAVSVEEGDWEYPPVRSNELRYLSLKDIAK